MLQISEGGIIVSDYVSKNFAEFGEYLIISNDGITETCDEEDFNKRYEIVNDDKPIFSDEKLEEFHGYIKHFSDEMKKIAELLPKINMSFSDIKDTANFDKILDDIKKNILDALNFVK